MEEFDRIYREQFGVVYAYVFSLCRDPALAEDVTQETFLRAIKNLKSYRGDAKLATWLCQIAKNYYFSHYKKEQRQDHFKTEVEESFAEIDALITDPDRTEELFSLVHQLPEPYKEVFALRVLGELSHSQIAKIFGQEAGWSRITYFRARKLLKDASSG